MEKRKHKETKEDVEEIRQKVEKHAEPGAEQSSKRAERTTPDSVSVKGKKEAYTQTMRRVRTKLNPAQKAFSAVIHAPVVEQASELAGKTIARPSGILGGGLFALIGLVVVTFYARRNGFQLAGSEFILLLASGFIVGVIIEITAKLIRRR